jgi:hypothetical protein
MIILIILVDPWLGVIDLTLGVSGATASSLQPLATATLTRLTVRE